MSKQRPPPRLGWAARALRWVQANTGYTQAHLSLGFQVGREDILGFSLCCYH